MNRLLDHKLKNGRRVSNYIWGLFICTFTLMAYALSLCAVIGGGVVRFWGLFQ